MSEQKTNAALSWSSGVGLLKQQVVDVRAHLLKKLFPPELLGVRTVVLNVSHTFLPLAFAVLTEE